MILMVSFGVMRVFTYVTYRILLNFLTKLQFLIVRIFSLITFLRSRLGQTVERWAHKKRKVESKI